MVINFRRKAFNLCTETENVSIQSYSPKPTMVLSQEQVNSMCSKEEYDTLAFGDVEYRALNKLRNSRIQDAFSGELSILVDRDKFCKLCLSENLIRYSNAEEDKKLITANECKEFLRSHSMKVSGKKEELVQRIEVVAPCFWGNKHYIITDKGMSFLRRHWHQRALNNVKTEQDIHNLKLSKYQISESEFNIAKTKIPFDAFDNDVIWSILNDRTLKYSFSKSFAKLRDNYLNMALLLEEEHRYSKALEYFSMVICFDINGYSAFSKPYLIPWIADRVYFLRPHYENTIAEVAYSQCFLKKAYFSEAAFISLINEIVSSEERITPDKAKKLLEKYMFH